MHRHTFTECKINGITFSILLMILAAITIGPTYPDSNTLVYIIWLLTLVPGLIQLHRDVK